MNAAAVVGAVRTYASINARGQLVLRSETTSMNELFDRMTRKELDAYARDGTLPEWFTEAIGATDSDSQEREVEG